MQLTPANVIRVHRQEITPGEAFAEQAVEEARTAAHWPPVLLARLAEAGLRIHRPDLAAYRARLAAQDLPPRPIGLPPPGPIVLVPYSSTHLGDTLALSHLPRLLAAQGYAVHVKDTPSTRAVFANNPHVLGFGGDYPTIRQRFARNARGHIMQLVARAAGCQADPFPRPEIHLTRAERGWAEAERDAWPTDRPAILVSTGAVTSREGYHGVDWQAYVDALAQTCHVVCPIVSSPATLVGRHGRGKAVADLVPDRCTVYADLPTRRFMALVAVCDAAIGTMAGTSHVAAALGVPYLCILPAVRPEGWELQFPVRGVSGNCDSRWLYPQHIFAYPEERPAAFPFTRAQVREQIIHPSEREHTTPGQISHVLTKYLLARQYQPSRIVEVGVRYGYAAAAFLLACPSAEYTGHDIICLGKGSNGGLGDGVNTFPAVRDLLARLAPEASVTLHHLNTQAMPTFPPADFYHIDGDHSIQGALSDICKAFAAADPGGVIVVDDYDHLRPVRQACDLFARQNRDQLAAAYYVPSWRGEFVLEKAGPGTDPDAPGRWSPGGELSTLQTQWAPPVQNVALVSSGMLASQMVRSLQSVTSRHGLDLPAHRSTDDYSQRFAAARNLVTWGVKWPSSRYQRDGRNVLFTENALLSQRSGIYIDHAGYFCDSSIATEPQPDPTASEVASLQAHVSARFGWPWFTGGDPDGPIMIAFQTHNDCSVRYHYHPGRGTAPAMKPLCAACADYLPQGVPVIVRPHPREPDALNPDWLRPDWALDPSKDVYATLRTCRALVTVSSTLATEALALGLPVACLGRSAWEGHDVVLECATDYSRLAGLADWQPEEWPVLRYLCAVMRHQLPYSATPDQVQGNASVRTWLERAGHPIQTQSLSGQVTAAAAQIRATNDPMALEHLLALEAKLADCKVCSRARLQRRIIDLAQVEAAHRA